MELRSIVEMLNDMAVNRNYKFGSIQLIRHKLTGIKPPVYTPFKRNDERENKGYTYHEGGRKEIQFNIGLDNKNGNEIFRYGLAISLQTGRDLPDPLIVLEDKIERFNKYIRFNYKHVSNYEMWYYDNQENKNELSSVRKIDGPIKEIGNFIFIGKYFYKSINEIENNDLKEILSVFDDLMPIYEYVMNIDKLKKINNKISRICWNTNGWVKPSGRMGKSKNKSHEKKYGFGHEEWLFDTGKLINGYHYAFLEPIRKFQHKYEKQRFNLLLYTIDGITRNKYWVGLLKNVEVIDKATAKKVVHSYKKNGWLKEMIDSLESVGLDGSRIENEYLSEIDIFNIRFKPKEVEGIFENLVPIKKWENIVKSTRYVLMDVTLEDIGRQIIIPHRDYDFNSGDKGKTKLSRRGHKKTDKSDIEVEYRHNILSDSFIEYLITQHGEDNVRRECYGNGGGKIDIVRRTNEGDIFYEIKTYNHLKTSVRAAMGQILEYATYPDKMDAIKLYLVSDLTPDEDIKKYIKHLNKIINIPIGYIEYNVEENVIKFEL